jgi:hypothetical protein
MPGSADKRILYIRNTVKRVLRGHDLWETEKVVL